MKVDGVAEADVKQVANDERSSHAMAKEEALQYAKSAASQLRDTGSSEKSIDAELPLAIDKASYGSGLHNPTGGVGGPRRSRGS